MPFVVNTTFSTGIVGVEVTSVLDGRTVESKGKLILRHMNDYLATNEVMYGQH